MIALMSTSTALPEPRSAAQTPAAPATGRPSVLRPIAWAGASIALAVGTALAAGLIARRAINAGDLFPARITWLCGAGLVLVWLTLSLAALDRPLVALPPRWPVRWLLKAGKRSLLVLQIAVLVIAGLVVVKWTLGLPVPWVP
jgi:hypothetical protein